MSDNLTPLAKYHAEQAEETRQRLRDAMATMESEIAAAPDGTYPENKGRISQAEICRRAGISESVPKQPHQHEIRQEMKDWIARLKKSGPVTRKDATERRRETLTELQAGFAVLAADVSAYRLRIYDLEKELARRDRQLADEKKLTKELRQKISQSTQGGTVTPLRGGQ